MYKAIARLLFTCVVFLLFPFHVMAANYGEGNYGAGDYGVGEVVNTSNSSSTQSDSGNNSTGVPVCNDTPPGTPQLFQIDVVGNKAKLFFTPLNTTNKFYISYSTKENAEKHGVEVVLAREGVQNFTVGYLNPNTDYYFKIRGQNGCMPGQWSAIVKARTKSSGTVNKVSYYLYSLGSKTRTSLKTTKTVLKKAISPKLISPSPETNVVNITPLPSASPTESQLITPSPSSSPTRSIIDYSTNQSTKKSCFLWWCW